MNLKVVGSLATLIGAGAGAVLSYHFLDFSKPKAIPLGTTARTRYPHLKVPEYGKRLANGLADNSFWWEKAKKRILQ